ncbi:unnamed protein product [Parnassius apollo]|uniref:(apollo) hypothetical protein n=1 Tax=Parnassius apollo TaxID=110799 RepID=A0A8S3YA08_PARAO|nr:unnamed protein product [Parnassius apollo]
METRSTPLENRPRLPRIALSKRNRAVVRALNPMLVTYLEASRDLCETDSILFGAALAVCRIIGAKLSTAGRITGQSSAIPAWRTRIEERIEKTRALIGRLICFRSGNTRPRIVRTVRMAFAGTNVSLSQPDIMQKLTERIDDLKQRIAAWGKRIRRYTERSTRFNQNRLFQSDQKRLYKSLERPMVSGTGPVPNQADTVAFWRSLWSEPVNHNEGPWTEVVASQCAGITPMDPVIITPDDVAEAVRRAPNWKSPGLDGLHHYWRKGFVSQQTSSGQATKKLANWQWAEQMSFVDSSTNLRQTESTLDTSTISIKNDYENSTEAEQVSNNEQNEVVVQELETARSTAETTAETATEVSRRRRRRVSNDDPTEKIINYLKTRKSGITDRNSTENLVKIPCDRMDMEFLGYAHTVKKFSLRKQAIIKLQITQIIAEAQLEDMNNIRQNSNFSNSSSSITPNFYYVDNDWNISRSTPSEELQTHSIPDTQNVSTAQMQLRNQRKFHFENLGKNPSTESNALHSSTTIVETHVLSGMAVDEET